MKFTKTLLTSLLALALLVPTTARAQDTYDIDPDHAFVVFKSKHLGVGNTWGMFRNVTGKIVVNEKKPEKSTVSMEVDAGTVYTGNKKRDTHLKSPDFLETARYPKVTFKSTSVKKTEEGVSVTGKLTLHGVTKEITVPMTLVGQGKDPMGKQRIGLEGELSIKRADYGITALPEGVGDTIHLVIAVEGIKK